MALDYHGVFSELRDVGWSSRVAEFGVNWRRVGPFEYVGKL